MDTHGKMASIRKFKNAKSANMENLRNINPMKIKAHMVCSSSMSLQHIFRKPEGGFSLIILATFPTISFVILFKLIASPVAS